MSNANGISNVFLRGIELASTSYTLNGATLTLSTPVALNDVITINKNVAVPGDQIEVLSDGSNWFVTSLTYAFNAVTLA